MLYSITIQVYSAIYNMYRCKKLGSQYPIKILYLIIHSCQSDDHPLGQNMLLISNRELLCSTESSVIGWIVLKLHQHQFGKGHVSIHVTFNEILMQIYLHHFNMVMFSNVLVSVNCEWKRWVLLQLCNWIGWIIIYTGWNKTLLAVRTLQCVRLKTAALNVFTLLNTQDHYHQSPWMTLPFV
jgi:hypothetical protein